MGEEQGRTSAGDLVELIAQDLSSNNSKEVEVESTKKVYFYSSPFVRAKEKAYACMEGLDEDEKVAARVMELGLNVHGEVTLEDGLMERYFGRLDGKELSTYAYVW